MPRCPPRLRWPSRPPRSACKKRWRYPTVPPSILPHSPSRVRTACTPQSRPRRRAVETFGVSTSSGTLGRSRAIRRGVDPELPRKEYSWEIGEEEAAAHSDDELELPAPREVPLLWVRPEQPEEEQRGVVLRFPPRDPPTS